MLARELAAPYPLLPPNCTVVDALRALAQTQGAGVVIGEQGRFLVIAGSQVLRLALPGYVLDDPSLARMWEDTHGDVLDQLLESSNQRGYEHELRRLLDESTRRPAVVDGDATAVEIAATMASARCPLVAVVEDGVMLGVVTVAGLAARLVG
jgi:CBS domain-containing protein